jgi:hypothetical protein
MTIPQPSVEPLGFALPFVGRDRELALLRFALDAALDGPATHPDQDNNPAID